MSDLTHFFGAGLGLWLIWRLSRTTLSTPLLFGATAVLSAAMALFVFLGSQPTNLFEDFKDAYLAAGKAVLSGPAALRPQIQLGAYGFVNIPIVAYLFAPFALVPQRVATSAFLLIGLGSVLGAWLLICRRYRFDRMESALALFALSSFGPLIYSFREGNASHILLLALAGGLTLSSARRDLAAGAAFAAAAIIKPPLLLIGLYYALRGRWRIVAAGLGLCVATLILSLLVFGWSMHVLWFEQFRAYASAPMPGYNDQSLAAAALRFVLGQESYQDWGPRPLPSLVHTGVLAATLALFVTGVWAALRGRGRADREDLEIFLLLAFICVASTVSWSHYYVWLLPGFAFAYARLKSDGATGWPMPATLAAFVLAMPTGSLTHPPVYGVLAPYFIVIVSHLLYGGLIFYAVLVRIAAGPFNLRHNITSTPKAAK
ncbi:MAG: glycosyltransferase family 87 protein [Alphaproteobacteria bacterium]